MKMMKMLKKKGGKILIGNLIQKILADLAIGVNIVFYRSFSFIRIELSFRL